MHEGRKLLKREGKCKTKSEKKNLKKEKSIKYQSQKYQKSLHPSPERAKHFEAKIGESMQE